MYQELWFDSATAIQTSSDNVPTDTPLFYFNESIQKVKSAKVVEVVVPQSFYNFLNPADGDARGHQEWRLQMFNPITNATANLLLPTGGGSALEFVDYMTTNVFGTNFASFQATFNTLTGQTLTAANITYNTGPETLSWNFTVSTDQGYGTPCRFAIRFPQVVNTEFGKTFAQHSLGFHEDLNVFYNENFNITFKSKYCNASPFNYMTLHSKYLGTFFSINPNANTAANPYDYFVHNITDAMSVIPLDGGYTSVMQWRDPDPQAKFDESISMIDRLDFYFTLGPYRTVPLNFNGQSFQIKMGIETAETGVEVFKRPRYI